MYNQMKLETIIFLFLCTIGNATALDICTDEQKNINKQNILLMTEKTIFGQVKSIQETSFYIGNEKQASDITKIKLSQCGKLIKYSTSPFSEVTSTEPISYSNKISLLSNDPYHIQYISILNLYDSIQHDIVDLVYYLDSSDKIVKINQEIKSKEKNKNKEESIDSISKRIITINWNNELIQPITTNSKDASLLSQLIYNNNQITNIISTEKYPDNNILLNKKTYHYDSAGHINKIITTITENGELMTSTIKICTRKDVYGNCLVSEIYVIEPGFEPKHTHTINSDYLYY